MAKGVKSLGQHLSVHVWVTITFTSLRLSLLLFMAAVATGGETRLLDRCIDAFPLVAPPGFTLSH
jgi:hypothetical protein